MAKSADLVAIKRADFFVFLVFSGIANRIAVAIIFEINPYKIA
jgi:voltage-gated potassium channel Kch